MNVEELIAAARAADGETDPGGVDAEALRRIQALDAAAAAMPRDELPPGGAADLVARALRPRRRPWPTAAAVLAGVVAIAVLLARDGPDPVVAMDVPGGRITVAAGSLLAPGDPVELVLGHALAEGGLAVLAGGARVDVQGRTLVSREPPGAAARETQGMRIDWKKLAAPLVGAAVGAVTTVIVLQGHAVVLAPGASPLRIEEGSRWTSVAGPGTAASPAALRADGASPRGATGEAGPELERLRSEREALVRERDSLRAERDRLKADLSDRQPKVSLHHFTREELLRFAEEGTLDLRLPHIGSGELKYEESTASALGLTPAEREGIRKIYADSFRRIRDGLSSLYVEIGGDPDFAAGASVNTLSNEIQQKALPGDAQAAVVQVAKERAGVAPVTPGGPAILRATRLLQQEDDRVVSELDALLGYDRAGRLLEDPGTERTVWVSRHKPE